MIEIDRWMNGWVDVLPEEITASCKNTAMAGKTVLLDFDGEVKQQASLPEWAENAQQLQAVGLGHIEQSPTLRDPIALWNTSRITAGNEAAGVIGKIWDTGGRLLIFIHFDKFWQLRKERKQSLFCIL